MDCGVVVLNVVIFWLDKDIISYFIEGKWYGNSDCKVRFGFI